MMRVSAGVLLVLPLLLHGVKGVDNLQVALLGTPPTENYLRVSSNQTYQLGCSFRAGYDDKVLRVSWLRYSTEVYVWDAEHDTVTVLPPLLGHVDSAPHHPHPRYNVFIRQPHLGMAGPYTCAVASTKGPPSGSRVLDIHVVDVDSEKYETQVSILSDVIANQTNSTSSSFSHNFHPYSRPTASPPQQWHMTAPTTPDPSCVLVWGFRTPAIAPRPEVMCGYYSYNNDAIAKEVPGGIQLHQLQGGAWQAEIDGTRIPVSAIPYNGRLGCSVTIPHTTYRKMIKFEDGLAIDHLIDSVGCSDLSELSERYGLRHVVEGATTTCRGDYLPESKTDPAYATISCPGAALIPKGPMVANWRLVLRCTADDHRWRLVQGGAGRTRGHRGQQSGGGNGDAMPLVGADGGGHDEPPGGAEERLADTDALASVQDPMLIVAKGDEFDVHSYAWPTCVGGSVESNSSGGFFTSQVVTATSSSVAAAAALLVMSYTWWSR